LSDTGISGSLGNRGIAQHGEVRCRFLVICVHQEDIIASVRPHDGQMRGDRALATAAFAPASDDDHASSPSVFA